MTIRILLLIVVGAALGSAQGVDARLAEARGRIDAVDARLVELLQQRARIVEQVGRIKKSANLPVTAPAREQQVLDKAAERAKDGPLPADAVRRIYAKIVQEMRDWETAQVGAGR